MFRTAFLCLAVFVSVTMYVSASEWTLQLRPVATSALPGLQSFAVGTANGKAVFIGGRTDGLHRRQPPFTFLPEGRNTTIYVVDINNLSTMHSADIAGLDADVEDQLSSTNMEFGMWGETLVLVGGYGVSRSVGDHATFPRITFIDLPGLIKDIENGVSYAARIKSFADERMAVTGGHLAVLDDTIMIVGGHRFDGRYNPMNGPSFVQVYTNSVRRFTFDTTGGSLTVHDLGESVDEEHLHRRDYNLLPQVLPDGSHAFTIYSGVFQHDVDLPFLHPVDVTTSSYEPHTSFLQYLNHYHSGSFGVMDSSSMEMHSFFLGGMSQYTVDDTGGLIRNDSVPFVTTIARVTRDAENVFSEHKLDVEFPDLEGSSAEFIMFDDVPQTDHGVILGHRLTERTTDIGLVVGGIRSSAPNIFWVNDGTQSSASSTVYIVTLVKEQTSGVSDVQVRSEDAFTYKGSLIQDGTLIVRLHLREAADVYVRLYDVQGRSLERFFAENSPQGDRRLELPLRDQVGPVLVAIQVNGQLRTFKVQ